MKEKEKNVNTKNGEEIMYPFYHKLPLQIRFNDIDILGHVNNSVYFSYFDLGKSEYFMEVRKGKINISNIDIVVANVNCNFLAPVMYDEHIEVQTHVTHIGTHSFTVEQLLVNADSGQVKSHCKTIMVGFDVKKQCSIELTADWIEELNKYERRELRDK